MKKSVLSILAVLSFFSCAKEQIALPSENIPEGNTDIIASFSETKVNVASDGKLSWANGDKIAVWASDGTDGKFVEFTLKSINAKDGSAVFTGNLEDGWMLGNKAVYPYSDAHGYADGVLTLNYPDSYEYGNDASGVLMVGELNTSNDGFQFKHAGGLIQFTINNIPESASKLEVVADKAISGGVAYNSETGRAEAVAGEAKVSVNFTAAEATSRVFNIPVPTGDDINFTVRLCADTKVLNKSVRSTVKTITRAAYVQLKAYDVPGSVYYVKTDGDAKADGSSWARATTLEHALFCAEDGETVKVAAGTYQPSEIVGGVQDDRLKIFCVSTNCTVEGGYAGISEDETPDYTANVTTLDANGSCHALAIVTPASKGTKKATVKGFTLTGGKSTADVVNASVWGASINSMYGAGVVTRVGSCCIDNCIIEGNDPVDAIEKEHASVIYVAQAVDESVEIKNCRIANTVGTKGYCAIVNFNPSGAKLFLENTTITGFNSEAREGSALRNRGGVTTLTDCHIDGNNKTAIAQNGVIFHYAPTDATAALYIKGGTISNNNSSAVVYQKSGILEMDGVTCDSNSLAGRGVLLLEAGNSALIRNCNFTNNTCTSRAIAVFNKLADANLENCIFSGNKGQGGLIYNYDVNSKAVLHISGSEFFGNSFTTNAGTFDNQSVLYIDGCRFYKNTSTAIGVIGQSLRSGGKTYLYVTNSSFTENTGSQRALYLRENSSSIFANCTFAKNRSTSGDGAIALYGADGQPVVGHFISCSVVGNENSNGDYGGIRRLNTYATLHLYNTVVAGNKATSFKDMDQAQATTKKNCALGGYAGEYAKCRFYDASGDEVTDGTTDQHYQLNGKAFNDVSASGTISIKPGEAGYTSNNGNLLISGMTVDALTALKIDLGQGVWDSSILAKDQLGNSRAGKTIIGACVIVE